MQNRRGQDLVFRNRTSEVDATIDSIFWQAERMSFRNDASCRIDDAGIFEHLWAYPGFQPSLSDKVESAPRE
jgi:hypothetical protein